MAVLTQIFFKMYFLYMCTGRKSEWQPFFAIFTPWKGAFFPNPWVQFELFQKLRSPRERILIFGKILYDISNRYYNSSHNPWTPQFWTFPKLRSPRERISIFGKMLYDISKKYYNSSHNPRTPQFWKKTPQFWKKTPQFWIFPKLRIPRERIPIFCKMLFLIGIIPGLNIWKRLLKFGLQKKIFFTPKNVKIWPPKKVFPRRFYESTRFGDIYC